MFSLNGCAPTKSVREEWEAETNVAEVITVERTQVPLFKSLILLILSLAVSVLLLLLLFTLGKSNATFIFGLFLNFPSI